MNLEKVRTIIEAIIFASERPVTVDMLAQSLDDVGKEELATLLEQLVVEYRTMNRPFHLVEVAGGWQFRTKAEYGPYIQRVANDRPTKLSRASLETLAVIAYKQPITRPEIEDLRGVDSGAVVKNLLERGLIKIVGKKDAPGKPVVYGTAPRFLEVFSLRDLGSLPSLRDLKELDEGESGQLVLPAVEGAGHGEGDEGTTHEPQQISDSERRKQIRESIRGLLTVPVGEDGQPLEAELPPPPDEEDDALAELEAALKRRKEAAERAEAVFEDGEKDYIEKITTENVPDDADSVAASDGAPLDVTLASGPESSDVEAEVPVETGESGGHEVSDAVPDPVPVDDGNGAQEDERLDTPEEAQIQPAPAMEPADTASGEESTHDAADSAAEDEEKEPNPV